MSYASTQIIGVLGKDSEVVNINGRNVLRFTVAVSNGKDAQGNNRPSTWYDVFFNMNEKMGWLATALKKRAKVFVEGKVNAKAYIEKSTGNAVGVLQLFAFTIEVMDSNSQTVTAPQPYAQQARQPYAQQYAQPQPPLPTGDDIPF